MEEKFTDRVVRRLREEGMKVTPKRIAIIRCLEESRCHPSVERIHSDVSRRFPAISLATVYNTLDTLELLGEVTPLVLNAERKYYQPSTAPHHHVYCDGCGDVRDVPEEVAASVTVPDDVLEEFDVERTSVLFTGKCAKCRGR